MNDHARLHAQLAVYRELSPAERRAVDAHLAGCAACRDTLAAYTRQDQVLAALPGARPRNRWPRPWHVPALPRARRWLGRLGDGLVTAGVAALLWMLALQVQYVTQPAVAGADATPAEPLAAPGLTLPPTSLEPPSPWLPALPWVGGALLLVGGLFVFSRRTRWPAAAGAAVAVLFLISAVPPLSAVPNPLGLYWRVAGGYSYNPSLPFRNQFLIAGLPEAALRPHLDALIGEVGLSPLDPVQPLAGYELLRVGLHPSHKDVALVSTRFIYADGSSRVYPVPLLEPALGWSGFWLAGWREDGLERLRSDHLALPGQPFATPAASIRLGPARVLPLPAAANRLDEVNPGHWLWTSTRVQRLVWSPDGTRFLAAMELDPGRRQLWSVALDGTVPALLVTDDVYEYGWSPDAQVVVYTAGDPAAAAVNPGRPYAVRAVPAAGGTQRTLATGLASRQLPGLTPVGVWLFNAGSLWVVPYAGGDAALALAGLESFQPLGAPRPSPDGTRVLFRCGAGTCLLAAEVFALPLENVQAQTFDTFHLAEATWTASSDQAAVVDIHPTFITPVGVFVLDRNGQLVFEVDVAPEAATEPPQWTPDGAAVLVQTYPRSGRRLIAVDTATRQVLDLSQEHWDAYHALAPDGTQVLMNNGRGYFWIAEVLR